MNYLKKFGITKETERTVLIWTIISILLFLVIIVVLTADNFKGELLVNRGIGNSPQAAKGGVLEDVMATDFHNWCYRFELNYWRDENDQPYKADTRWS